MDMDHAARAGSTAALGTARFEYAAHATDYDAALRRFSWGTWPGRGLCVCGCGIWAGEESSWWG
ncbi:hypothetical protein ACS04_35070 [Streptomyces roseus]|uniref:Uncharacterized protein n=1 Tax=Streptomyces roseus TaxID=66430 RepID=A0A0J6XH49_9ACTN|nr:hypothetical protein ACS04_35070 [Streptomyces roseus]